MCYDGTRLNLNGDSLPWQNHALSFLRLPKGLRAHYGLVNNKNRENCVLCNFFFFLQNEEN